MARIATDPVEQANSIFSWEASGFVFISTSVIRQWQGYGGARSIQLSSNANVGRWTSAASKNQEHSHVHVKCAFYRSTSNSYAQVRLFDDTNNAASVADTTGRSVMFGISGAAGTIRAYRDGTEIADSGIAPALAAWHLLEAEIYLHDTNGRFKVWHNKNLIIDFTGDTSNGNKITRMAYYGASACYVDDGGMNSLTLEYDGASGVQATGTLTLAGQPNDGDQVDINGQTYTFNTVLGGANSILIGAAATNTIDNLIAAISDGAGEGTTWGTGTPAPHADVTAAAGAGDTMDVTAIEYGANGNAITTTDPTDTSGNLSWGGATLSGGSGVPVAGETVSATGGGSAIVTFAVDDGTGAAGVMTIEGWNGTDWVDNETLTTSGTFSGAVNAPNAAYKNGLAPYSTRMGNSFVTRVEPNDNGNSSGLTGSDGNSTDNYLLVDELVTTASPADYVEATAVDQKDTYKGDFANAIPSGATIECVTMCHFAQSALAGIDGLTPVLRIGGTDYDSATPGDSSLERIDLGSGYEFHQQPIDRDPSIASGSDQSWTRATLAAAGFEFGQKFIA